MRQLQTQVLLQAWQAGGEAARDALIARIHPELVNIAAARLRAERHSSLSTGDLINEAIVRLVALDATPVADRAHLLALASRMMRHILVDRARSHQSDKRRHHKVELTTRVDGEQRVDLMILEAALVRLAAIDPALMELVEMRYFGGMTVADVAIVTGWSEPTVKRRWQIARAWLLDALANPIDDD